MAQRTDIFNVGKLGLSSGEGRSLNVEVAVDPFEFGGQRYELRDGAVDARLDISHTVSGYAFRLRFDAGLEGPCVRCRNAYPLTVCEMSSRASTAPSLSS